MYSVNDKIFLQTKDIPNLKSKIIRAIELSNELELVLKDLNNYDLEFEIDIKKEET